MIQKVIQYVIGALIICGALLWLSGAKVSSWKEEVQTSVEKTSSRVVMERVMDVVREKKPAPPESARLYAIVATVYYEVLRATSSSTEATAAADEVLRAMYSGTAPQSIVGGVDGTSLSAQTQKIITGMVQRVQNDARVSSPRRLLDADSWVGDAPLAPAAGAWKRWVVGDTDFAVPTPPELGTPEFAAGLDAVRVAAASRTHEQEAIVQFWGGVPGTEAPAGIWQNRLYDEVRQLGLTDSEYARVQMILAQTVADAFMECWKVKYTYWTKRPSMIDVNIKLAMPNPNFPSYVSGHSTISAAAATVLGALFPEKKDMFMRDAEAARDSRLWAGIHFPYDNEEGFQLGVQVGERVVQHIHK